jgi:hypothetical protein
MKIIQITENISHTAKRIRDIEKEKGVTPGTPEWFKLWFSLPYLKESIEENFADGKVKGKSRPGRVKRSGASCNGSVTELRAKAKKASGEKAKMYHWCANMKAGKKK